ncbi:MAG: flagellar basal-body rod protein FlgF [Methyloligellaceae bacterium]
MENALLIGLTRQIALRRQMNVVANNLANVNTAGFKADSTHFKEYLMPVAQITDQRGADRILSYVNDSGLVRDFAEGSMVKTGKDLHVALSGDGWLVVGTPDGERYTRNGELTLNSEGVIVTNEGLPVLGDGGEITIGLNESGLQIAKDGTISTDTGLKGDLRIVKFAKNAALKKEGASLYATDQAPEDAPDATVVQGMIEKSNVKAISELTTMVETVRAYTSVAQTLQRLQQLRQDAISKLSGVDNS